MRLLALLAVLALAALPQFVEAGGCGYSAASYSTYTPVYQSYAPAQEYKQKEVYVASYLPYPVLVPTYSVTLAPAAAYSSTTTTTTTQAAQQTTAATAQVQQATAAASVTAEQITALTAAITALQQQVASNQPAAVAAPVKTSLEQCQDELRRAQMELRRLKAGQVPRPMPKGDDQSRRTPEHIRILTAQCAACHDARTADEKGKGFILLDGASLAFLDAKALGKIAVKVGSGKMPPRGSGQEMSDQERAVVLAWLDSAAR